MSYTALDSIQWGGVPKIGVSFGYDSRRSGSTMQYRIYVTVAPLTGASYFGYPIYLSVTVDGGSVCSGHTLKAASPSRWSSAIEYDSGWVTAAGAVGTAPLGIRLYSGSGSARDDSYGYALPVERVEDIGDFSLTAGDAVIGQTGTLTLTRPGYGYSFTFSYVLGAASGTLSSGALRTVSSSAGRVVYQWTVPESLAGELPETTHGTGTVTVKVYSGGTPVGSLSAAFTAYVPETMRPTAALTTEVVNDGTAAESWGLCVQGISRIRYAATAAAQGGASVRSVQFRFAGQELTGTTGTTAVIGISGTLRPTVTVTDSRGRSATATGEAVTVAAYYPPAITASMAARCAADGTEKDDGAYLKVKCAAQCADVQGHNTVVLRARFRPMGGAWSGYTALLPGAEQLLGGGLDGGTSYEVELSAEDTVGNVRVVRYTAAMEDTLGKAVALTGGYASSYAQSAGQQAYNGYLQELAAMVPELRQAALAEYQQEGKALQNQYSMLDAQEKADYDRWQAARGDWQKQLEAAQAAYEDAGSQDQKLYQTLLAHFSDKAEQERKLSASGVRLTDSGDTGSRGESLSSTAAESLQRAVVNYLKRGNGDLAQALAAQYTARMTPAQRQRLEKLLGQYGMTLV